MSIQVTVNTSPLDSSKITAIAANLTGIANLTGVTGTIVSGQNAIKSITGDFARTGINTKFAIVTGNSVDITRNAFIGDTIQEANITLKGIGPVSYVFNAHADGFKFTDADFGITMIDIPHPFINDDGSRNQIGLTDTAVNGGFFTSSGVHHVGDIDTAFRFPGTNTATIETSGVERLRVNKSGKIGIGTTNPQADLHVEGDTILSGDVFLSGNMVDSLHVRVDVLETMTNVFDGRTLNLISATGTLKSQVDAVASLAATNDLSIRDIATGNLFNLSGSLSDTTSILSTATGILKSQIDSVASLAATNDLSIRDVTGATGTLHDLIIENQDDIDTLSGNFSLSRTSVNFANLSLINAGPMINGTQEYNYVDTGALQQFNTVGFNSIQVSQDCRVRIYNSINYNDLQRVATQDASNSDGLILEVALTANEPVEFNPAIIGAVSNISDSGRFLTVAVSPTVLGPAGNITGKLDVIKFT